MKKFFVNWINYDRSNSLWRANYNFRKCSTLQKAERFKKNLLKQSPFIVAYITILYESENTDN